MKYFRDENTYLLIQIYEDEQSRLIRMYSMKVGFWLFSNVFFSLLCFQDLWQRLAYSRYENIFVD